MHEDLVRLDRVDTLDRERWRRESEIHKQQSALADAEALVASRRAALAEREAERDANRKEERAIHRRLEEYRQRRASGVRMLEQGRGDPEAAQRQIERCDELIDEAETEMLERLEAADGLDEAVQAAQGGVDEASEQLAALQQTVPERVTALQAEIRSIAGDREGVFASLPGDIQSRYASFRGKRKWAVARVKGDSCDACRMKVAPQIIADLRRGLVVQCRGCKRWLVEPATP
jgi:predicted  nucleic acid-binding Zn-ribbon protein